MGVGISYMGTKKDLAPVVASAASDAKDGAFLDLFSGMCSVAEEIGQSRQIWTNDIQQFSTIVAESLFTSHSLPLSPPNISDIHYDDYNHHVHCLHDHYGYLARLEEGIFLSENFKSLKEANDVLDIAISSQSGGIFKLSHNLFTTIYANTFFGVSQSIEIDSIVYAIDQSLKRKAINKDQYKWMLVALGRAMLRVSNSTGHFAQYQRPNERTYKKYVAQRKRSIWTELLRYSDDMAPIGEADWRSRNKAFNEDSITLLDILYDNKRLPSVIYADPPYTDDQYSRFYHVFETLVAYDYPKVTGFGRYRPNRFRTPFSVKSEVIDAMDILLSRSAKTGSQLILSYPTNGLLYKAGADPFQMMTKHFGSVECFRQIPHSHSTFGASKGTQKALVIEQIFVAKP